MAPIDVLIQVLKSLSRWEPRVIIDRDGEDPYLTRYYLLGGPETEGMHGTTSKRFGLYLHHFHKGDDAEELHNHPWAWACAYILKGGYSEERRAPNGLVYRRWVRPGELNTLTSKDYHRVDLDPDSPDCWSLFLAGPRVQTWGFWDRCTGVFTEWRTFLGINDGGEDE